MFKEYKEGDILTLGGCQYEVVTVGDSKFFLSASGQRYNDSVFTYLGVNKFNYVQEVLGYCNAGGFPECNNIKDLNKLIHKLQEDCLIKEAKERYPEGTKFIPAHTPTLKNQYCISHGEFWIGRNDTVVATLKNGAKDICAIGSIDSPSEEGNTLINRNVFYEGRWAKVYNNGEHIPNYVKITNNGNAYTTHSLAKKYGCSNYDYGVNPENGWVCKVLNEVLVNDEAERKSYILEHDGKHYIVGKAGCVPYDDKLDKPKFEVGKYYSFNWIYSNDGGNRTVIAKIKTINTITIDVSWRNYLWYNDSFPKYSNDDTYKLDEIADIKELSIEEVQQYLPDDHPDKIIQNNLIPGKWYKVRGTCEYIAKLVEIKDGEFITPGYFIQNGEYALSYAEHNRLINIGNKVFTEVPIEEVQQYLPDNHPDKIIKKKYTLKELIDNKIIVYIDSQEEFDKISKAGKKIKGFIPTSKYYGKYCYSFKNSTYSSYSSKTNTGTYNTDCIIIAIDDIIFPEESINYVGRYIRILQDRPLLADVRNGDIFQVKEQHDNSICYDERKWSIPIHNLGILFELMPEDYIPERINPNTDFIFEPGGYYVGEWEQGGSQRVIFKTTTNKLSDPCYLIDTSDNYEFSKNGCCTSSGTNFRKANQDEIQWLDECIKEGRTVSYESTVVNKKSPDKPDKWSPGTYVFIEKKGAGILVPELSIYKINDYACNCIHIDGDCLGTIREKDGQIKWFATLREAEDYKLSLPNTTRIYFSKQEYLQAYPITPDDSIFIDEQEQLNNIKDDKLTLDIKKYQVDLSVKSALKTNFKYFNNN